MYYNMQNKNMNKGEREAFLRTHLAQNCNITTSRVHRLNESTEVIRHSCYQTGVTLLNRYQLDIPMQYGFIPMFYYVCPVCGNLYIVNSEV